MSLRGAELTGQRVIYQANGVCLIFFQEEGGPSLTLSMLGNIFSRRHFEIFPQKIGFEISCKYNLHEISNPIFREK